MNDLRYPELDLQDVRILPNNSSLASRKDVNLIRTFLFNNGKTLTCTPIIASNMLCGSFSMAKLFYQNKMLVALYKHYSAMELIDFFNSEESEFSFYSLGILDKDLEKFNHVKEHANIKLVNLDIANAYTSNCYKFVKQFRLDNPGVILMVGNVVTQQRTIELFEIGVDIAKIGLGNGCFTGDSLIQTVDGNIAIKDVKLNSFVLTHNKNWQKVTNIFKYSHHKELIQINDIKCTPDHKFYVVDKKHKNYVTIDNISDYAQWISAEDLSEQYLLIKYQTS